MDRLMKRGQDFLNVKYPIICGAMTWVSDPKLVATVCNHGAFGCLAGGNTPPEILRSQIAELRNLTDKPFAVNLITIAPAYQEHIAMLKSLEQPVPYVVFAGSIPKQQEIAEIKSTGAKTICFASTISIAERMIRYGADALVLEGAEAGGHIGHVSTTVLIQQLLFQFGEQLPIFVAGGVATGRLAAHLFLCGAAGIQMGTRFVMTEECQAHPRFKEFFAKANARDAMSTAQFDPRLPVVSVRVIRNHGTQEFSKLQLELLKKVEAGEISRQEAQLELERFWVGSLRKAVIDGDIEYGSVMAGQSVGLMNKITTVREVIEEIVLDGEAELQRMNNFFTGN
ncbi:MAG: nitronate monooxygenase [Lentisphaeria bacterium]|nr:nitronate monooxygenase [Lentisphaeria bacterium]